MRPDPRYFLEKIPRTKLRDRKLKITSTTKLIEIETYLTSLSSITKDNCLKLTENLRTGCIILRNRSDYHLKMLFNPEKTFEILRVKEKIKEAEDYSQRIHLHLENNCLESSQIVDLISNIHILIDYFEKIACLKLFSDELNEQIFLVKTQLKKE